MSQELGTNRIVKNEGITTDVSATKYIHVYVIISVLQLCGERYDPLIQKDAENEEPDPQRDAIIYDKHLLLLERPPMDG